jgi:hypothetical protein
MAFLSKEPRSSVFTEFYANTNEKFLGQKNYFRLCLVQQNYSNKRLSLQKASSYIGALDHLS